VVETRIELTLLQILDPAPRQPAECRSETVVTGAVVELNGSATGPEEPRLRARLTKGQEEGVAALLPVLHSFLRLPVDVSQAEEALEDLGRRLIATVPVALERRYTAPGEVPAVTRVDVCLPLMIKREKRAADLTGCSIALDGDGRIELRPADEKNPAVCSQHLSQTVLAVVANTDATPSGAGWQLRFADHRVIEPRLAGLFLPDLLESYGFPAEAGARAAALSDRWPKLSVEVDLAMPAAAASCWAEVPEERTLRHYAVLGAVALQLQRALRRWIPYIRFDGMEAFANRDAACAALVYQASRPFHLQQRPEFNYDPMNMSSVDRACRSARSGLKQSLARVEQALDGAGDPVARNVFRKRAIGEITRVTRRGNRHFLNLIEADKQAVGRVLKLGLCCRDLRAQGAKTQLGVRKLAQLAAQIDRSFRTWYRRLLCGHDIKHLASLTLIEGTAVLAAFHGQPAPIEATLRLRHPDSPPAAGFVFRATTQAGHPEPL